MEEKVLVRNAADKKQVKSAAKKEKSQREKEIDDVYFLLQNVQGRRFLYRYLTKCGVYRSSFTGNSQTFFREGERNIGIQLIDDIMEADPDKYTLLMKENRSN